MDRLTAATVFVAIVERGSLAGAAERLDMSRAMVSRYLAEMEDWVQARLLHRTTRRLSLTPAGERVLTRSRGLLALAEEMPQVDADAQRGALQALLRIGCAPSLAQEVLPRLLQPFLLRHPGVRIDIQARNDAVNLVEQRIDLALRITNQLEPNLIARRIGTVESVLCAAPSYLARRGEPRDVAELALHDCLNYTHFGQSVWQFNVDGVPQMVPVNGCLSADDSMVLAAAARRGLGITLQPRYAVQQYLASGELCTLLPWARPMTLGIHALYSTRKHLAPALRLLLDHLAQASAQEDGLGDPAPLG